MTWTSGQERESGMRIEKEKIKKMKKKRCSSEKDAVLRVDNRIAKTDMRTERARYRDYRIHVL